MNILQLNTSIFGDDGQSSRLADAFVERLGSANPAAAITRHDFSTSPMPHLTAARFQAALTPAEERSAAQQREAETADLLIDELSRADVVVIGLPMYNFGVPSTLKSWFDHVARAGTTFRYTADGPRGLLTGKKVYVFATRGGIYADTGFDHQTPFVTQFLGMLGMDDVEFVYAEGLAIDETSRRKALTTANARVAGLAA